MKTIQLVEALFLVCLAIAVVLGLWVALTGCQHDGCEPAEQRCRGNRVETCDGDEDWYTSEDCDQVEPVDLDWVCCYVQQQDLYACIPRDKCEVDGGTL